MRNTARNLAVLTALVLCSVAPARAQLVEIDWGGTTGNQAWHSPGNWVGGVVPNTPATPEPTTGKSLQVANLSMNLGAGLTVDLAGTDARIAGLRLGSTSGAIATNVTSTGVGRLIFRNDDEDVTTELEDADFNNDTRVDGRDFLIWQRGYGTMKDNINDSGDANLDDVVDGLDLAIWQDQYGIGSGAFNPGSPGIESKGVAGVTNTISAPIHLENQQVEIAGPRDVTISGNITYEGDPNNANTSSAGLRAMTAGSKVTITSPLVITNSDAGELIDFQINNHAESAGTMVIESIMSGAGDIFLGRSDPSSSRPLGTIELKNHNTYTGSIRAGRGNLLLYENDSLGVSPTINQNGTPDDPSDDFYPSANYRQQGPVVSDGYNMISMRNDLQIPNQITMAQWQTVSGQNSIEFTGRITQTNNRGFINTLQSPAVLKITGDLDIWEDDEILERRFVFDGSGRTEISGAATIGDDDLGSAGQDRRLQKTGTGVLLIDVEPGNNNHSGPEVVLMGNLHYANNGSLNVSTNVGTGFKAEIISLGGAVGVDSHPPGQNLATNAAFLGKFNPDSVGGLMLSASDAAVNLDFSSAALTNVRNMSLAAPETGISYTGTLTPYNNQYRLGGGSGTLTLPNAQLTGVGRSVSIRNGGTVRLEGSNTYTGATVIESKYTSTNQIPGQNIVIDELVNPTLEVTTLANGGANSSIGASSNVAANLYLHAGTLKYVGNGSTTDRLFTIGTAGGTLDASGTGAVVFSNTGAAVSADVGDIKGTLDDFGGNPDVIYNVSNSRDVVIGMTIADPDAENLDTDFTGGKCGPEGRNCIPALTSPQPPDEPEPVVVTGVSNNGNEIGLNAPYPELIYKENTTLVLGTVDRTLTLTGTNTQANILSPVIANSAKGGEVNIVKQGTGTWLLDGVNTSTGTTTVEAGTLGGHGGVGGALTVNSGATFAPGGGASAIGDFSVAGSFSLNSGAILAMQLGGTTAGSYDVLNVTGAATLSGILNLSTVSFSPAMGNQFTLLTAAGGITDSGLTITGLTGFTKSIVGNSLVLTKTAALSALASVPEPSALVLMGLAMAFVGVRRR